MNRAAAFLLLSLFLTSCAQYSWHQGSVYGPSDPGSRYPSYGHFNTTGRVAELAGLNRYVAARLAYFSQAPDDISRYNAVPVAVWGFLPGFWSYRFRVEACLHSLHGGIGKAVIVRREKLEALIARADKQNRSEHWRIGFLIHALGDSFAHTHSDPGGEKAFGPIVGHGLDFTVHPDCISCHMDKYERYVRALYRALGGPDKFNPELETFIEGVRLAAASTLNPEKAVKTYILKETASSSPNPYLDSENWRGEVTPANVDRFLRLLEKELETVPAPE